MHRMVALAVVGVAMMHIPAGSAAERKSHAALSRVHAVLLRGTARPAIVENGTDDVQFALPIAFVEPGPGPVAFSPDGRSYFKTVGSYVTRFSPDGTYKQIPVKGLHDNTDGPGVVYMNGNVWVVGTGGVVELNPIDFQSTFYNLGGVPYGLAAGPGGALYTSTESSNGGSGTIIRIGPGGSVTSVPVQDGRPEGVIAFDRAGNLYSGFEAYSPINTIGFARLATNGTLTYSFVRGDGITCCIDPFLYSLVYANGYLYFSVAALNEGTGLYDGFFGRISPSGVITQLPLPGGATTSIYALSVDQGGNIWTSLNVVATGENGLYQYDTYNGRFSGPYTRMISERPELGGPYVGPDDNVWFFQDAGDAVSSFGAYVRHVQTLEPATLSLTANQTAPLSILETHFNGPWTAQSLGTSVATVSPSSSLSGDFFVSDVGPGMTSIAVKDRLGNVSYELVMDR